MKQRRSLCLQPHIMNQELFCRVVMMADVYFMNTQGEEESGEIEAKRKKLGTII